MSVFGVLRNIFSTEVEMFVRELHKELLHDIELREKDLKSIVSQLKNKQRDRFDVFKDIITSHEFEKRLVNAPKPASVRMLRALVNESEYDFIRGLYREIFNREPDPNGFTSHIDALVADVTRVQLVRNAFASEEVKSLLTSPFEEQGTKSGSIITVLHKICQLDNSAFLSKMYNELLNRDPDEDGRKYYRKRLNRGRSKYDVMLKIVMSDEFKQQLTFASQPRCVEVIRGILEKNDSRLVRELYREVLEREAEEGGLLHHTELLNTGTPKIDLVKKFLLSDEFRQRIFSEIQEGDSVSGIREKVQKFLHKGGFPFETTLIVKGGGLGDVVQMTPVAKALKTKYPNRPIVAIVEHFGSVLESQPYIDGVIEFGPIYQPTLVKSLVGIVGDAVENLIDLLWVSHSYGTLPNGQFYYDNAWYYHYWPHWAATRVAELDKHVCDLMLHSLALEKYATCSDVFVAPEKVKKISDNYVVVCDSVGSEPGQLKRWIPSEWKKLISWLLAKGITPIQLGTAKDTLLDPRVVDLRGKTSPRQAAGYLKQSRGYIGIEGGLFHLAKASGARTLVIFSTTPVKCYAYPDTYVATHFNCTPCWWTEGAFMKTTCLRGHKFCANLPTADEVIALAAKMLGRSK